MGLTIHYQGKFRPSASLQEMISEVKDVAESHKWKYYLFREEFPSKPSRKNILKAGLFGICFTPPNCETVFISFLSNGRMADPIHLELEFDDKCMESKNAVSVISVKTQFAGPDIHKIIVDLLRYLNDKYFEDFSMFDESSYWDTEDESEMRATFDEYTRIFNAFAKTLKRKGVEFETGISVEKIIHGIEKGSKRRKNGGDV